MCVQADNYIQMSGTCMSSFATATQSSESQYTTFIHDYNHSIGIIVHMYASVAAEDIKQTTHLTTVNMMTTKATFNYFLVAGA